MEKPLPAYIGAEPFVFVCYSHADSELVYPEIHRLQAQEFRIWYDDGIAPGSEWSEAIAKAIESCSAFLYLITPNAVASEHCRREVNFALEQKCSMLAVHLVETEVPSALKLSLSHRQAILKYNQSQARYESRLHNALRDAAAGNDDPDDSAPRALAIGDFALDIASQRLQRDEEEHLLDPKDMSVLLHLAEAAPGLVSTEDLLTRSWPGTIVGDNVVHQVIGRLRKALGDSARNPSYIETLPRRGYRLLHDVQPIAEPQQETELERLPEPPPPVAAPEPPAHQQTRKPWLTPVAIGAIVVALIAGGIALINTWRSSSASPRSFAVLPLVDLTPTENLSLLSDGISQDLLTALTRLPETQVVGFSTSYPYRESGMGVQDIGDALGVAYMVDGTVRKSGDQIRVTLELISVEDGFQGWSDVFEKRLSEGFDAETEIAQAAALAIAQSLDQLAPALQLPVATAKAETTKPSLQDLFDTDPAQPSEDGFPTLEDVDVLTFDDMGDVE